MVAAVDVESLLVKIVQKRVQFERRDGFYEKLIVEVLRRSWQFIEH